MELKDGGLVGTLERRRAGRLAVEPADAYPQRRARANETGSAPMNEQSGAPADGRFAATLDELLSTLSHELRGPLTTIKGSARTLLRHGTRLDAEITSQLLTDIDSEADRLHRLVDNLLDLSRAGAGPEVLKREPTAVDTLIRRVVADATPRAGDRKIRVRATPRLPAVLLDPLRIEQVFRNLLDNAIKFSPSTSSIDVAVSSHNGAIVIIVADEGPGIAPEYQERVFERFFRVQPEGLSVSGAGLGLAICRRFVDLHGGRIEIVPSNGRGTTVRVTLPLSAGTAL